MNQAQADALIDAGMRGTRQIKNVLSDGEGGYCAMGILHKYGVVTMNLYSGHPSCPECGLAAPYEAALIVHLNNDHGWDFIAIARKLGP